MVSSAKSMRMLLPAVAVRQISPQGGQHRAAQIGDGVNDADGHRRVAEPVEIDGEDDVQIRKREGADAARGHQQLGVAVQVAEDSHDYAVAVCACSSLFFRRFDVAEHEVKHAVVEKLQKAADENRHAQGKSSASSKPTGSD